ncbi:MAG TPA: histone deacetylase, partial [bacterium]|nr:histone deacetylase [bacterium]
TVLFISTHESPLYPGTGQHTEIGNGAGKGYTLNIPMHAGDGDMEMETVFDKQIIPALDQFKPELLFISAGFDAHARDPLANMTVTSEGFGKLTRLVVQAAEKHCQGRVISVLEGGYHLEALGASVVSHIRQLAHE